MQPRSDLPRDEPVQDGTQTDEQVRRFRAAMDMSGDAIYLVDRATMRFVDVNQTACARTGYTREELLTMGPQDLLKTGREDLERRYDEVIAAGDQGITTESTARYKDGRKSQAELHRRALRSGDGWIIVSIARDITQRKRAEAASRQIGRMYAMLSSTNEAILRARLPDDRYPQGCDAAVFGGELISTSVLVPGREGHSVEIVAIAGTGGEQLRSAHISVDESIAQGRGLVGISFRTLQPCVSNDFLNDERTQLWHETARAAGVMAGAAVPLLRGGRAVGVLLFYADQEGAFDEEVVKLLQRMAENIAFALDNFEREAERKQAEQRIQYLATHDELTDLPNRVMFSQLLKLAIESARRHKRKLAVLFIDLDNFKTVNDTLGHEAGDELLKRVATRLKGCLRSSDVVARQGGDEFVVLVQEVAGIEDVVTVARKILSGVIESASVGGQECGVTATVGIALYPADAQDDRSLMKSADIAMYLAKEQGRNTFQFFSDGIETPGDSLRAKLR